MGIASRFAAEDNQTIEHLARLDEGEIVEQWRDSTSGEHSLVLVSPYTILSSRKGIPHRMPGKYLALSQVKSTPRINNRSGIGRGSSPFDVSTALIPSALNSISSLSSASPC